MPATASGASSNGVRTTYLGYYERTTGTRPALTTPVVYERFRLVTGHELAARATAAR